MLLHVHVIHTCLHACLSFACMFSGRGPLQLRVYVRGSVSACTCLHVVCTYIDIRLMMLTASAVTFGLKQLYVLSVRLRREN